MSLFFFLIVIAALSTDPSLLCEEILYLWALFAIADALWFKNFHGGK